jgi:transcriptional regulator with XRE-family HTH domain
MVTRKSTESKNTLFTVQQQALLASVPPVETAGQRIKRLKEAKGWKRPQLVAAMTAAVNRKKPFLVESIRQYEEDETRPGKEALKALALVFGKEESYILFGDRRPPAGAKTDAEILYTKYLELGPTERRIVDLMLNKPDTELHTIRPTRKLRSVKNK